jgi:hypothetical protein
MYNKPNLAHDKNFHKKNTRIEGRDLSIHKTNQKRITKNSTRKTTRIRGTTPSIHPPTKLRVHDPQIPTTRKQEIQRDDPTTQKKTESTLQKLLKKNNTWTHCELGFGERRV